MAPFVVCLIQLIINADENEIAFMGMPVAVACPEPDGVCHNLRVMTLETKMLPQVLWHKLTGR